MVSVTTIMNAVPPFVMKEYKDCFVIRVTKTGATIVFCKCGASDAKGGVVAVSGEADNNVARSAPRSMTREREQESVRPRQRIIA